MAKIQFKVAKESLAIAKTKKYASIVAAQKVCNQMEYWNNHLLKVETTLQPWIAKMDNNLEEIEDLWWEINTQKWAMISFKGFAKEGVSTYEKLNKALDSVGGALNALERKLSITQRTDNVMQSIFSKFKKDCLIQLIFPFHQLLWRLSMNQHVYGLRIALFAD